MPIYRGRSDHRNGKILKSMPNNQNVQADKVLEINPNHEVFQSLKDAFANDKEKLALYTSLLYNQALLIEGLPIQDPVEFTNDICKNHGVILS
ncbi:hypothetical protein GCM10020331_069720 [Ectobacillus funiculus]